MPRLESLLAQAGLVRDEPTGAISTPIYLSSTFRHPSLGKSTGFDYTRTSNPTRLVLEQTIAELEKGARAFAFGSGMAALTAVLTLFSPGDVFLVSDDLYGGTYRLFEEVFARFGIRALYVDCSDTGSVEAAVTAATKAVLLETPTNPLLKISDIRSIADICRSKGLTLIVDNTFMTPFCQRPIEYGADIVVHSGTKSLSGHSDVVCGFVVARDEETASRIGFIQNATGGILSPSDSWLVLRGLKTLSLRLERSQSNAMRIAEWLSSSHRVSEVLYPGLPEHPGHALQKAQSSGFGSMISFRVKDFRDAERIINTVRLISFAESLGGCETLITYPALQTHGAIPEKVRRDAGITEDLLRLSIGIEHVDDLLEDLAQAVG